MPKKTLTTPIPILAQFHALLFSLTTKKTNILQNKLFCWKKYENYAAVLRLHVKRKSRVWKNIFKMDFDSSPVRPRKKVYLYPNRVRKQNLKSHDSFFLKKLQNTTELKEYKKKRLTVWSNLEPIIQFIDDFSIFRQTAWGTCNGIYDLYQQKTFTLFFQFLTMTFPWVLEKKKENLFKWTN